MPITDSANSIAPSDRKWPSVTGPRPVMRRCLPRGGAGAGALDRRRQLHDAQPVGLARPHLLATDSMYLLSLRARSVSAIAAMIATSSSTAAICSG